MQSFSLFDCTVPGSFINAMDAARKSSQEPVTPRRAAAQGPSARLRVAALLRRIASTLSEERQTAQGAPRIKTSVGAAG